MLNFAFIWCDNIDLSLIRYVFMIFEKINYLINLKFLFEYLRPIRFLICRFDLKFKDYLNNLRINNVPF